MKKLTHLLAIPFFSLLLMHCQGPSATHVQPNALFTDNAVLQRGKDIIVWGTADPGGTVEVELGESEQQAQVSEQGTWQVTLPAMEAGGPYELEIEGAEEISLKNIMIGDVWLASGQSNMEWALQADVDNFEEEIANADFPNIRLFTVERNTSYVPLDSVSVVAGGWLPCSPETVPDFSAVAYFFGREIHQEQGVPVGLISSNWGGTPAEAWTSESALMTMPDFKPVLEKRQQAQKSTRSEKEKTSDDRLHHEPAILYNAMIAPLVPYPIRGVIWYQGESNAGRPQQYATLFPTMIKDWRQQWGGDNFPFLYVQLANFKPNGSSSDQWAYQREAQNKALALENTGVAVTINIGDSTDIHPRNKQDVGDRLATAARAVAYGDQSVFTGPMYESMRVSGDSVVVTFKGTGEGLMKLPDEEASGFMVAGEDRQFVEAVAHIVGPNEVSVWSSKVEKPVAVRYGWANNPAVNVYSEDGLPVSPFRTDDWEKEDENSPS